MGNLFKQPHSPIWVVASESHYTVLFALTAEVQATDALGAIEDRLLAAFSEYDTEGNGFISAEHLPSLASSLPQWSLPPVDDLRRQVDPDGTSLLVWDRFQAVLMPLHPDAAEAMRQKEVTADAPAQTFELLHYNGLGTAGHAHKRALRTLAVTPGVARGHPNDSCGIAAVLQTRWKDSAIAFDGPPPSIN